MILMMMNVMIGDLVKMIVMIANTDLIDGNNNGFTKRVEKMFVTLMMIMMDVNRY